MVRVWGLFERESGEVALIISAENPLIGVSGLNPAAFTEGLDAVEGFEGGWGGAGDDEFAIFREANEMAVGDDQGATADGFFLPLDRASGGIDAGERGIGTGLAIWAVEVTLEECWGIDMGFEGFIAPDFGELVGSDAIEGGAGAVA